MARAHWLVMLALLVASASAQAQDEDFDESEEEGASAEGWSDEEGGDDSGQVDVAGGDPDAADKAEGGAEAKPAADRPWSFGPYVRFVWVPAFIQNIFLDEAPEVFNPGFGVGANYRGETSTLAFGIGYTSYAFADAMRKNGGEQGDTEWADSDLGLFHISGSILWRAELAENLELDYGIGLDFGIVTGELTRTEAFVNAANEWQACTGPLNPDPFLCGQPRVNLIAGTDPYDVDGEQYGVKEEDIPPVFAFPMMPHLRLRYNFIPELAAQLELSYGIAQFWFGLSATYAPEM